MERLLRRGELLAAQTQQRQVERVAARLRNLLGDTAVEVQEARVVVRGRGMLKRWLTEPGLRFLTGEFE